MSGESAITRLRRELQADAEARREAERDAVERAAAEDRAAAMGVKL